MLIYFIVFANMVFLPIYIKTMNKQEITVVFFAATIMGIFVYTKVIFDEITDEKLSKSLTYGNLHQLWT